MLDMFHIIERNNLFDVEIIGELKGLHSEDPIAFHFSMNTLKDLFEDPRAYLLNKVAVKMVSEECAEKLKLLFGKPEKEKEPEKEPKPIKSTPLTDRHLPKESDKLIKEKNKKTSSTKK